MLLTSGELQQAEWLLRRALDVDPAYAPALCNYARLKQRSGTNLEMAANMFAKARTLMPNSPYVLSSCALFMEESLHDINKYDP
jgi:Tfp pilus assembly protein PilF